MTKQAKTLRIIIVIVALTLLISGALVWHHKTKPYHLLTVEPGVLYRSGVLKPHNLEKVVSKYGIRTIVGLRLMQEREPQPDWYNHEKEFCEQNGLTFVHIPLRGNTPPDNEQLAQWLALLDNKQNHPVLVHCAQGAIRAAIMSAIYQMEYGHKDNQKTLDELDTHGHHLDIPKRKPMCDYILNYVPRWKQQADTPASPAEEPDYQEP